jgi:hypothetical protein
VTAISAAVLGIAAMAITMIPDNRVLPTGVPSGSAGLLKRRRDPNYNRHLR